MSLKNAEEQKKEIDRILNESHTHADRIDKLKAYLNLVSKEGISNELNNYIVNELQKTFNAPLPRLV